MYRLRGHHLFCLLGYRGMGYSQEYAENMTRLHQTLRAELETVVQLVLGPDDLCAKFPDDQPYHCEEQSVFEKDTTILRQLGLENGQTWTWRNLEQKMRERVIPEDIPRICSNCAWLSYGVCEEGVRRLKAGEGLPIVE